MNWDVVIFKMDEGDSTIFFVKWCLPLSDTKSSFSRLLWCSIKFLA